MHQVSKVLLEHKGSKEQHQQVRKDHKEYKALQVHKDHKAHKELLVYKAQQEHKVLLVLKD